MSDGRDLGVVVIGRNEGERLARCFASLGRAAQLVYVDSGSTDGSVALARARGISVVELDMDRPFTAARARNAGLDRLDELGAPTFVQFVDGDCEVNADWLQTGLSFLRAHPDVVAVAGRVRERFPEATIYNAQCDREWNTPVGETKAVGGIAMMRFAAVRAAGNFNPTLIAGEEPELCVRLRQAGGRIWRIEAEMVLHDAAMTRFSQYWKRSRRGGYAFAQGAFLHGAPPERHWVAETRRALLWGAILPACIIGCAVILTPWALALAMIYPAQVLRIARRGEGLTFAALLTVGKFAEALGVLEFHLRRLIDRPSGLIEYRKS